MKAPAFWFRPPRVAAALLAPASALYEGAGRWRRWRTIARRVGLPVVCVGNLVAGGAGKTPVALALALLLRDQGHRVHFLTRGYGGRLIGPERVVPARHGVEDVGDEALLLAAAAPTWLARDRVAGALAAARAGATIVVLDDGYQNPALAYDFSLVVVDGAVGFGNGRVIPAGPLREPVLYGLARASALVILGEDRLGVAAYPGLAAARSAGRAVLPICQGRLAPDQGVAEALRGRRVLAFAGIGRPAKFFETCHALGAQVVGTRAFADHHRYGPDEEQALMAQARALEAMPVTTAKDAVRLTPATRAEVWVLPVTVEWREGGGLLARLLEPLSPRPDLI